jgi:hypothetical protein
MTISTILWILVVCIVAISLAGLTRRFSGGSGAAQVLRDELRSAREEANRAARESREELSAGLKLLNETSFATLTSMA